MQRFGSVLMQALTVCHQMDAASEQSLEQGGRRCGGTGELMEEWQLLVCLKSHTCLSRMQRLS